tara:strand:- start:2600 stop:3046 length:447 start_codon:yes stop_codon:yes gene_type:complete
MDLFETRLTAGLAVFISGALQNILTYMEHSNRTQITSQDLLMGLKLEVFKFGNSETFNTDITTASEIVSQEIVESEVKSESADTMSASTLSASTSSVEVFSQNSCTCPLCTEMNSIEERYAAWIPATPLEKSVHATIAKSEAKFMNFS